MMDPGDEDHPRRWFAGMRAKWLGAQRPKGATSNPPAPGSVPYQHDPDQSHELAKQAHVTVIATDLDGFAVKVRRDDGFEFDPSIDHDLLVPASYPGWVLR